MSQTLLAKFRNTIEAEEYLVLLEEANITFRLTGLGVQDSSSNFLETLDVWVEKEDFEKSQEVISQHSYFQSCPNCGSRNYKSNEMENIKKNTLKTVLILFLNRKNYMKSDLNYICNDCGTSYS